MRRLIKPAFLQDAVLMACMHGVNDLTLKSKFEAVTREMVRQEASYNQLAALGKLHDWVSHGRGGDDELALGQVTRGEFKGLYTQHMARKGKPARGFYDRLRMSAPDNRCPYCGIGSVETIDHFLPKGRYSPLSILPSNLIPACSDCNKGKLDGVATVDRLSCHPYFEDPRVFNDEWLFASVIRDPIIHVEYHVVFPPSWGAETSIRVLNHLSGLDLYKRFSVQAAGRMTYYAHLINGIINSGAAENVPTFLQINTRSELAACGVNSWELALAKAVSNDAWFCVEGYTKFL